MGSFWRKAAIHLINRHKKALETLAEIGLCERFFSQKGCKRELLPYQSVEDALLSQAPSQIRCVPPDRALDYSSGPPGVDTLARSRIEELLCLMEAEPLDRPTINILLRCLFERAEVDFEDEVMTLIWHLGEDVSIAFGSKRRDARPYHGLLM